MPIHGPYAWLAEEFNKLHTNEVAIKENLLLEYNQKQIDTFNQKFGDGSFDLFNKSQQRLKNAGYTTDINVYLSDKWSKEDFLKILNDLDVEVSNKRGRLTTQELSQEWGPEGEYKFIGSANGYDVYQPLDVEASMSLGVNTGWCTTGRYRHYGHPEFKPSYKDAKEHWDDYTGRGIKFYYFLNSNTKYGEYAIAIYPKILTLNRSVGDNYIKETNFEIYNAKDILDYSAIDKIPINLIKDELHLVKTPFNEQGLYINDGTLVRAKQDIEKVDIPDSVTEIGNSAFRGCISLTKIQIPDSVTKIGDGAFVNCTSLQKIDIPDSVTRIGAEAFYACTDLTKINIPNSVTKIDEYTFQNCTSLKKIHIPDSVTEIGERAFIFCKSLTKIQIPDSVTKIDDFAFAWCLILLKVNIPNSVTEIGEGAFEYCTNLTLQIDKRNQYAIDYAEKNKLMYEIV